jgi:hypothetical protein
MGTRSWASGTRSKTLAAVGAAAEAADPAAENLGATPAGFSVLLAN